MNAHTSNSNNPQNYAEWCLKNLGKTFSEEFVFKYTKKYWTLNAEELSTDWIGPRIYPPSPEEVIKEYDKKNEEKKPTAAEVITLIESQEPMTVEKIQERSKKLRRKVFGDNV